ncbi:1-phosphatidylinositol 4,5-bisphosphate phosphodiesterase gamma-1 isoform X1 [Lynx rufus]|uniref:1-phosphatidylinositol 4,5-bisphosphate phosphodiesterase gamma-1 isoform X1 n=1 Tax=Lynx rufus TaxID=61384 RepID=UPI001F124DBC|nr:1-phosphatidylinositol 4,5-bisphosphate phosphodiesterase gamma-1 isoform X1 [Lynx rufus]XP_046923763.1 1-phosphatidylinositol 4,5-bisphosphate phosphodiesterase gamma-1 isoform X1 [Lynx rufus]XP_046923764.1 1-phosphatidylinositol 4,5-bisphosphate phosphodiesterase gamma-1 isoform X1 [Lynx rufus]XP_046923765.1 1-phosphatidylinositol 4,5-bisphosphate phosphodiesterase gamma-1 isoform X1 [Lynx rufus]XP_046923766.1 1-phosphatidylinositol 4,5-bisphosphate phosphodiesterase gamma-1 isoform X1 [Ly
MAGAASPCANGCGPGAPSDAEVLHLCRSLEVGTVMTLFYSKKSQRPERKTFQVKLETRQITWSRGADKIEGAIDIREIKEIRPGKTSRDFDRYQEDPAFRTDQSHCFVILYGMEFRLKTLSLQATSEDEVNMWIKGLTWLMEDTLQAATPLQIERWLRKQFYSVDRNREDRISAKDLKNMLSQVNYRVPNMRFLRERLTDLEQRSSDITYGQFAQLYRSLMYSAQKTMDLPFLEASALRAVERPELCHVSLPEFQQFLLEYQGELWADDRLQVQEFMLSFLRDPLREIEEPYFFLDEFVTFLFSKENSVWNSQLDAVCPETMNNPLSHYWISSSHNTYLTGDQFSSESSLEAYARCLRMGCRCIELDCWDGPDGMPVIYHGHTLTTKIKFSDVLHTIKEHAFVASEYPVILSIEDHCSIAQQRNMAQYFKKVLGDTLLTKPVDIAADGLPSPNQLKRKILIKHKKLAEGSAYEEVPTSVMYSENDISNSIKNGILYLEDPVNHEWYPHYFVLTSSKIYYSEETSSDQGNEDEEEPKEASGSTELHSSEKWFHGKLGAGRDGRHIAERLLTEYCIETGAPDGSFLVRESETFVGDYTLSFWRNGKVQHCRIHSRQDAGAPKFFLTDNLVFDSLYDLITHYQQVPLRCNEFEMRLSEPVPQTNAHESKEWYHASLTRAQAEHMLMRVPRDGAFLVRKRNEPNSYAISFRAEGKIKHCRVQQEGQTVVLGNSEFDSLVDLISYYEKHPLYRKMKLRYPINEEALEKIGTAEPDYGALYEGRNPGFYVEANPMPTFKCAVKALFDYKAQREDELTFTKSAIIQNVEKQEGGWWRGDYGGKKQLWFPSNYVEEMVSPAALEPEREHLDENSPLGDLLRGVLDVPACQIAIRPEGKNNRLFVFSISMASVAHWSLDVAADSQEELQDWVKKIREVAQTADARLTEGKMMERRKKIALELSELVVYCRPVPFDEEKIGTERACYRDMSSFPETKAEKYVNKAKGKKFLQYNRLQLSRIYPKGQRLDSSNYDPLPMWICGSQLVALNFQTPDKPMQMNQALFMAGGHCGYVLQPSTMRDEAFDPFDKSSLRGLEPYAICIEVLGARHLPKNGRGIVCPFVEIEVAGAEYDSIKQKTEFVVDNGLNPVWPAKPFHFQISNPEFAFLRFVVYEEDMFSDQNFLAQATFPVKGLKAGYRAVPLKNNYSEDLELASLLIKIEVFPAKQENGDISPFSSMSLRERGSDASGQLFHGRGREGSFEARYQQPFEDFRISQEHLADHFDSRERRAPRRTRVNGDNRL